MSFIFLFLSISVALDFGRLNYPREAAFDHSHLSLKKSKHQSILAGTIFHIFRKQFAKSSNKLSSQYEEKNILKV